MDVITNNSGLILLTVLITVTMMLMLVASCWAIYISKTHKGKQDRFVNDVNNWMEQIVDQFTANHNNLSKAVTGSVMDLKSQVDNIQDKVAKLDKPPIKDFVAAGSGSDRKTFPSTTSGTSASTTSGTSQPTMKTESIPMGEMPTPTSSKL